MGVASGVPTGGNAASGLIGLIVISAILLVPDQLCVVSASAQALSGGALPCRFPPLQLVNSDGKSQEIMGAEKLQRGPTSSVGSAEYPKDLFRHKALVALTVGTYGFGTLDMRQTAIEGATSSSERDPFAKPLVGLPHPAYFATGYALLTGVNWLAWKMDHSRRLHRIWWLPQVATMSGNIYGYASSRRW
jgi:hypothetical protein